ncbi:hypothetical protein Q7P37_011242 [Cladosporium fusiforme]
MAIWNRKPAAPDPSPNRASPIPSSPTKENADPEVAIHAETTLSQQPKWQISRAGDGDVAMALFDSPLDLQHDPISPEEDARVKRKIDWMILPYLGVCYAFFYIDKTTLSYAAIFGIREDLDLQGTQYSWLSSIFYFGFLAWAFPTGFLMQRLPIGRYLGFNIFLWGAFLMLQAAAHNFEGLAALRAFAGAAEACSDPSFILITSMWYKRSEQPRAMGTWYLANGFGIALGGLLGFGIGNIKGSLPSWKFEFIIIGALCSIWGVVMYIFLPDSPVTAKGLSLREKRVVVERLRDNQTGVENKHLKMYQVKEAFCDVKLYLFFVLGMVCNIPNGGISNFGTIIIKGFGFSTLVTTLMQIPYGAIIALSILLCVFANEYVEKSGRQARTWFILLFLAPNIAGAFGLAFLAADNQAGRLVSYYLTGPYNAAFVMVLSMSTANTAGHTKKVVTNAVLFLGYCTGNIAGPFFYLSSQSPRYTLGIWSMIVSHLLEAALILLLRFILARENRRRDKVQSAMEGGLEGRDLNATAFGDLTDWENLNFRYIY